MLAATLILLLALAALGAVWFVRNPVLFPPERLPAPAADAARLRADVEFLAAIRPVRNAANLASMDAAARHIADGFAAAGCTPGEQVFEVGGNDYRNIICSFGPPAAPRVIIGAHYDVDGLENPGADDNASGVAAILELARMVSAAAPALGHRLDLVAYALEEMPYSHTTNMASYVHAASLARAGAEVRLMVSIEMIGFYADAPGSQAYPIGALRAIYPGEANFIGVVGQMFARRAVARVKGLMSVSDALPVYSINAPENLTGVDFSDHWSFWRHGMTAVMVTDTAFYRNPNYHRASDTPETLDFARMKLVVDGLYQVAVGY